MSSAGASAKVLLLSVIEHHVLCAVHVSELHRRMPREKSKYPPTRFELRHACVPVRLDAWGLGIRHVRGML